MSLLLRHLFMISLADDHNVLIRKPTYDTNLLLLDRFTAVATKSCGEWHQQRKSGNLHDESSRRKIGLEGLVCAIDV